MTLGTVAFSPHQFSSDCSQAFSIQHRLVSKMASTRLLIGLVMALLAVQAMAGRGHEEEGGHKYKGWHPEGGHGRHWRPKGGHGHGGGYDPCKAYPSLCKDPVLKTPGGHQFYFHGHKDADFCLVSDTDVHVNAHFIGLRRADMTRDFTWVQALGLQFGGHQLYIGANKVAQWDDAKDQLFITFDSTPVVLPAGEGALWQSPANGITVQRLEATNLARITVEGVVEILVKVVPVSQEENQAHNYGIDYSTNSMAHLDVSFKFAKLTSNVHGVLGQTYAPGFKLPEKLPGQLMPSMRGDNNFLASSLFSTDCSVSRFGGAAGELISNIAELQCGPSTTGSSGMVCRR